MRIKNSGIVLPAESGCAEGRMTLPATKGLLKIGAFLNLLDSPANNEGDGTNDCDSEKYKGNNRNTGQETVIIQGP
jgi:hypothetical protein